MSYGYIIATSNPATCLETSRRYRFSKIQSHAGIDYYLRLEEGGSLTGRRGSTSVLTGEGAALLGTVAGTFWFMDFLMGRKEGDEDVLKRMQSAVGSGHASLIKLAPGIGLEINKVYRVES